MAPDRTKLDAAVQAVADGEPVDWQGLEAGVSEVDRGAVSHLRLVARVAEVHRSVQFPDLRLAPDTPTAAATHALPAQATWGPLILRERIGGGAYGDVYRARDPRLDRDVALKLLRSDPSAGESRGREVIEEARLLARVRHPHVVTVFGADSFDGRVGLWMEFIHGRSLDREVLERGPLGAQEAAVIGLDVCAGLAAVHQAGLVHRDVKAGNVMREEAGRMVLMDFGTGYAWADPAGAGGTGFAGTPLYAAPEVFAGEPATPASDLYSLGVLLYYLVTGTYPVVATTIADLQAAHQGGERRPLRDARPDLPAAFITVVERALETDPHNRFPSSGAMEAALRAALVGQSAGSPLVAGEALSASTPVEHAPGVSARAPSRRRNAAIAAVVVAAVLVAGGLLGYRYWPRAGQAGAAVGFQPRDWVLIAAFENRTGDAKLDGTVEYALERELGNSHFVNIVPRERIGDTLALMRKPVDTRLDESIGREVCLRDGGIRVMVTGRVEKLGSVFDISARVFDPASGRPLMAAMIEAPGEDRILRAVRDLSGRIRAGLGEARQEIEATDQALEKVTTPSLKALQLFSQGMGLIMRPAYGVDEWRSAKTLFEQAISEDPEFASAHVYLSYAYQPSMPWGDRAKQRAQSERALALSEHTSERERLFIQATYFQNHGQLEEARATYEALVRLHPDHYWALNNLWFVTGPEESLPYTLRLAALRPNGRQANALAAMSLVRLGRAGEAEAYAERARAIGKAAGVQPTDFLAFFPVGRRWVDGDAAGAMAALRERLGEGKGNDAGPSPAARPGASGRMAETGAAWLSTLGRLAEADAVSLKQLAELGGQLAGATTGNLPLVPEILLAWNAQLRGDRLAARDWMRRLSIRVKPADRVARWEAVALQARTGLDADVRQCLGEPNTVAKYRDEHVRWARGELALAAGRPVEAAALLTQSVDQFRRRRDWTWVLLALQALSSAVEASRGPHAALDVIVNNIYPADRLVFYWLGQSAWLDLQARRARLLRQLGRPAEAEPIEAELRKFLAYADPDMLIVNQLAKTAR